MHICKFDQTKDALIGEAASQGPIASWCVPKTRHDSYMVVKETLPRLENVSLRSLVECGLYCPIELLFMKAGNKY